MTSASSTRLYQQSFQSMGCPCAVALYATSADHAQAGFMVAESEVHRLDRKYSHYRAESYISQTLAAAELTDGIEVDAETASLLDYAQQQYRLSAGRFDITAHALTRLWDRIEDLPANESIHAALMRTGWNRLDWSDGRLRIPAGMSFDMGGMVKEYAADRCVVALRNAGYESGYIDLGGDLHFLGAHPHGRAWSVGIRHPDKPGRAIASIALKSGALASSGNYERFSEIDGHRYGHIINALSGWPVEGLMSVSVIGPSCLVAGSMTTLAMLLPPLEAQKLLAESGLPWLTVDRDFQVAGSVQINSVEKEAAIT